MAIVGLAVFYLTWDAIMIVGALPACYFATRTRWEYRGNKDRMRTYALLFATVAFLLTNVFTLASDGYSENGIFASIATYEATYSGLSILAEFFQLIMLLSTALVFFRTAIALLYGMGRNQKLGLTRIVEIAGAVGFALLVVFAVVVWALYIHYLSLVKDWYSAGVTGADIDDDGPQYQTLNNAFLVQAKVAVAYEWIYFAFATIFLPIVFLQTLGRRSDRIAVLLLTFAILLIDALHVLEVVDNLVFVHKGDPFGASYTNFDLGLNVTILVTNSLFALLAIYCLIAMGMRDPKRLTGESEPAFAPVAQQQQYYTQDAWHEDTKYDPGAVSPAELPSADNRLLDAEKTEPQELPSSQAIGAELPAEDVDHTSRSTISRFFRRG